MAIERRRFRGIFAPAEQVELKQVCFTPSRIFQPGKYKVEDLPDIAFEMGLVEKVSSTREQNEDVSSDDKSS